MALYKDPNEQAIINPVNLDKILTSINEALQAGIPWLTYAFLKATKATEERGGVPYLYPEVYRNDGKYRYINVLPSRDLINFSFWLLDDPVRFNNFEQYQKTINAEYKLNLVFWLNLERIPPATNHRQTEEIKRDIIEVLVNHKNVQNITECYEGFEQVWAGFSLEEVKGQYFKQPYAGLRFVIDVNEKAICYNQ